MIKTIDGVKYKEVNNCFIPCDMVKESTVIKTPNDIVGLVLDYMSETQEHLIVLTLDGKNSLIKKRVITKGLVNQSQGHPREIFRPAILDNAVSIVLVHNHPSGNLDLSQSDIALTKRMSESGTLLGIPLLDHVVISVNGSKSIRESNPECWV